VYLCKKINETNGKFDYQPDNADVYHNLHLHQRVQELLFPMQPEKEGKIVG
jgi:hypothetical protein